MSETFRLLARRSSTAPFGTRQRFPIDREENRLSREKREAAARARAETAKLQWSAIEPLTEFQVALS